jgi:predicted amidohydrolase
MEQLKIGLVHLNVRHNQPEHNLRELISLNREAAQAGAKIIVNTELCISGYSFRSCDDIAGAVQTTDGPMIRALANIAFDNGAYIVAGYAERDDATGIFYNSATVLSPEGNIACHYRKTSAEVRWACPGTPQQQNTFETPWGRVGILICSDTYFGAVPRTTALRGADIILVPANWPSEPLDPSELWQSRAYENGIYIAACNRGGTDRTMEFQMHNLAVSLHPERPLYRTAVRTPKYFMPSCHCIMGNLPVFSQNGSSQERPNSTPRCIWICATLPI